MSQSSDQLTAKAAELIPDFSRLPGVTPDQARQLEHAIVETSIVIKQLNAATTRGDLLGFAALEVGSGNGGAHDAETRKISVPVGILTPNTRAETKRVLTLPYPTSRAGSDA